MIGGYRKYFKESWDSVLWGKSWINFQLDMASIPDYKNDKKEDVQVIDPENEEAELKKLIG